MAKDTTISMLSQLGTLELSNVRRPANRKKYAITKSETDTMDPIKAVLSTPAEGEEQLVATLKSAGADQKRIDAVTALFRMNKGFSDLVKPEDLAALGLTSKAHKEPDDDEPEQGEDESDEAYKARLAKAKKAKKSADQTGIEPNFKPTRKSADDPAIVALSQRLEAVTKSAEANAAKVKSLEDQNAHLQYVAKAEREFSHVPGSAQELAKVLKSAHDAGPEAEKIILSQLASTEQLVAKSAMLGELGTSGGGVAPSSAWGKITALAQGLTMKSDSGKEMTLAQKVNHVVTNTSEGRELYKQYLAENPKQRA